MAFDFSHFQKGHLDEDYVDWLVHEKSLESILHCEKLWSYYTNDMGELQGDVGADYDSGRPYRQAQEYGLPGRITGLSSRFFGGIREGRRLEGIQRKEVVIENDIAWRIDTIVDFLFGKPVSIVSQAPDKSRAAEIEAILATVFETNGGTGFFRECALLGSIYGFVDVILRWEGYERPAGLRGATITPWEDILKWVRTITLEPIEAPRSLPILDECNYKRIQYYIQHWRQNHHSLSEDNLQIQNSNPWGRTCRQQRQTHAMEILGPDYWQRYEDKDLVAEGINPLGFIPVVHIQNMVYPGRYEGQSDVEPLIPLQDELNTRLSDRASRITLQSFKMYLGKGIEGFERRAVSPGRMWSTQNPDACIEEFGGDDGSPSEEYHINHIREALDKSSGVASVAAGILKGRIGNLTSAVALKVTLMGVLAKTERKRRNYGKGIREMCAMVLAVLDKTGLYPNRPEERHIAIHWPSPLPENLTEKLQEALMKKELGVSQEQVLKELGYMDTSHTKD